MDNSSQSLELQLKTTGEQCNKTIEKLVESLTGLEKEVSKISVTSKSIKQVNTSINGLKSNTDKATSSANKLEKALTFSGALIGINRLTNTFLSWLKLGVDYTEQLNLFNVVFKNVEKDGVKTFSTLGKKATEYQNKLNEAFGTNKTDTLKYQGLFQSMGENAGISDDKSAIMSQTMTNLTYDLASLYNKSESATAEAIRAGVYAGQTKPLRNFGVDVTQTTMQPVLESLGITDKSVKELSQGEKEILRYIATLRQAKVAMGDYANTIESPANQMKIFNNQLVEAKIAFTSLFIGAFSSILPYANAFLMVIKEISSSIATMFGIEIKDYNTSIASQSDAYDDLTDSVDGTTDSVKKLKQQTMGFDEINNINDNNGGESSPVSGTGGIDQRLLDSITGYENGMEKVKMRATEIKDEIMKFLSNPLVATMVGILVGTTALLGITKLVTGFGATKSAIDTALGVAGAGAGAKGLAGFAGVLATVAEIAAIGIGIAIIIYNIADTIKNAKELVASLNEAKAIEEGNTTALKNLCDEYWNLTETTGVSSEKTKNFTDMLSLNSAKMISDYYNVKKTKEEQQELSKQLDITNDSYYKLWTQGKLNDDQTSQLTNNIMQQIKMMDKLGINSDELKTKYENLTGKPYDLQINANVNDNTGNFFDKIKNKASSILDTWKNGWNVLFGGNKANGGVYANGSWNSIPQYANGGSPSHGSMFVAGEAGAEMVGHINGRTEVLNQSQIASAIYSAVVSAMNQSSNSTQVDVRVHSDNSVVIDEINQKTMQTGICPINIPMQ